MASTASTAVSAIGEQYLDLVSTSDKPGRYLAPGSTIANGTVPTKNVVGRVVAVIWPVRRWSGEPIPETFDCFRRVVIARGQHADLVPQADQGPGQVCCGRTEHRGPCDVGTAPEDVSPFGVKDVAGNGRERLRERVVRPADVLHRVGEHTLARGHGDRIADMGRRERAERTAEQSGATVEHRNSCLPGKDRVATMPGPGHEVTRRGAFDDDRVDVGRERRQRIVRGDHERIGR